MSVIRRTRRPDGFYILDNNIARDKRLSWPARGILIYLLTKPDNWQANIQDLINQTVDSELPSGRDAVRARVNELERVGYIRRSQTRDESGKLTGVCLDVYDYPATDEPAPDDGSPETDNPAPDKPASANPTLRSTELKEIPSNKKETASAEPSDFGENFTEELNAPRSALAGDCKKGGSTYCRCKDCQKAVKRLILNHDNRWDRQKYFDCPSSQTLIKHWSNWNTSHPVDDILREIDVGISQKKYKPGAEKPFSTAIELAILRLDFAASNAA